IGQPRDATEELAVGGAVQAVRGAGEDLLLREEQRGPLREDAHRERPVHHESAHGNPPRKSSTMRANGSGCSRCGWCPTPGMVIRLARSVARRAAVESGTGRSGLSGAAVERP